MMRTAETPKRTLQDAIYILSIEKEMPDAALLDDVIRAYPEFSEELTDFAIDLAMDRCTNRMREEQAIPSAADLQNVSPAVSRALSRFQNCLHSVQTTAVSDSVINTLHGVSQSREVVNSFALLSRDQYRNVARNLNVNTVFISKFRDQQIVPNSIPREFQRKLAAEINVPIDLLVAHLAASQGAPQKQFYKAKNKPTNETQQSFEEAVRGSGLSKEQQEALLEL
ncbi:MAG: hypothetical protein ACYCOR_03135 [Acidobacteriaceae bacterium]